MADISPDLAARIESLKASHAENPARFFMPLASAWREAGEVGKAEELLRENLKRHPGYLSAHVLLGRCLADRGALAEARNEFQYVLSVDSQNLIALRTLGDMAAAQGQQADARRWYNELLAVDPMNADARQALHHLDTLPAPVEPTPAEPKPNDDFGIVDLAGTPDAAGGEPADFGAWGEVGMDAGTADIASAGDRAADAAGPAWGEAPLDSAPAEWSAETPAGDADTWGAVDLDADRVEDFAPTSADDRAASADGFDALDFGAVDVSSADTAFEASEPEPAASGFDGWGSVDDGQLDAASATPPLEGLEAFADEPVIGGAHDAHDDHAHEGEEEEVVTETMAELYARQGFLDRSADVYRELISRRGAEPALVRRLEELEAQMEGAAPSPASSPYDFDTDEEEAGPPAWLQAVDAASTAGDDEPTLPDLGLETTLPDLDIPTDLAAPPAVEAEEAQALADMSGASPFPISADEPETAGFGLAASGSDRSDEEMPTAGAFAEAGGDPFADSFARGFGDADDAAAVADGAGDERAAWETPTVEETEPVPGLLLDETPAFAVDTSAVDSAAAYADFDDEPAGQPAADLGQPTEDQPSEIAALAEDVSIFAEPIDFASAAGDASADAQDEQPAATPAPDASAPSIRAYMASLLTWRPGAAQPAATSFAPSAESEPAPYEAPASEPAPGYDAPTDEPSPPFEAPEDEPSPALEAPTEDNVAPYDAPAEEPADDEPWAAGAYVAEEPAASGPAPWETPAPAEDEPWAAAPSADASDSVDAGREEDAGEDLPWMNAELDAPAAGETAAPEGFEAMDRPAASGPAPVEGPRADEMMPWDAPFELAGEVEDAPVADRAGPRPEPTVQDAGGFSFEDFFGAPPAEPAGPAPTPALETRADLEPVYQPEPEPQPPAPPASGPAAPAGEEDEDLESFQAWLQSLKR
jgi:tetratricopeptide (TPR) repeat protein